MILGNYGNIILLWILVADSFGKSKLKKNTPLNHQTNLANPRIPLEDRNSQLVVSQKIAARNHMFLFPLIITNNLDDTLW